MFYARTEHSSALRSSSNGAACSPSGNFFFPYWLTRDTCIWERLSLSRAPVFKKKKRQNVHRPALATLLDAIFGCVVAASGSAWERRQLVLILLGRPPVVFFLNVRSGPPGNAVEGVMPPRFLQLCDKRKKKSKKKNGSKNQKPKSFRV
jgi:hypothetical protein